MKNNLCDVCNINPAIGVACTSIPYSCAFCRECAERGADPEIVFHCWYEDFGTDFDKMNEAALNQVTYKDGFYITYKEWATKEKET